MSMSQLIFWFFSALALVFACLVVVNRNPVASALSLVVSFLGLAAIYVCLDAYFIGVIQILVYAGAVMVLFLFIIMLMDLKAEERRKINYITVGGSILIAVAFVYQLIMVIHRVPGSNAALVPLGVKVDDVRSVGMMLFSKYNLPFQAVGVLLLISTIGVIVLSKRELK